MDQITRCPKCGKRTIPVVTISGRTDFQCISCEDPAVKWAESPLTTPEKPIVAERAPALEASEAGKRSMTRGLK
jgi:tRNA(Ile2) C34 agmatinyltransferase TiaS